ncbi:hypothetical protein BN946_scf184980.g41 [Trametes cinnabarina]|uniref:CigA protein n=1 Tax=Pycnoporus cinnabarinus TaxID=5643 RepID=A0A060SDQ0_PYCCI|nr:hypothetical protein BN946_scf184980.g41 [Trametes cinnabarina]
MVVAVVLLTAGLGCLSLAYHILTTAWLTSSLPYRTDSVSHSVLSDSELTGSPSPTSSGTHVRPADSSSERFLAYLPHSGFHNQRIALENALVLARILNRTLLLPLIRLGDPLSYAPFDELYYMAGSASKAGLEYCRDIGSYDGEIPVECEYYLSYSHISWDWLVDLSGIRGDQRLLDGWNFTDAWLEDRLGVAADEIFYLKDASRNEYSFQDFFSFDAPARKFDKSVHIAALARRPERLIQMGTLFGSSRLHLRSETNYGMRKRIRERMAFKNPHLVRAAEVIRAALGGSYLGVHLRIGDGIFEWNAPENVRLAWWKLLKVVLGLTDEDILVLERDLFPEESEPEPPAINPDLPAMRTPHPQLAPFPADAAPSPGFSCRARLHTSPEMSMLNAPLFISTDARSPTFDPLLARFRRTFPCSFFLEDFPEQIAPLGKLRSPIDGVPLGGFLMPFLDAMVVGQAWQVVGTEQSTFSAFVSDVLWRTYHGFEIVQRG